MMTTRYDCERELTIEGYETVSNAMKALETSSKAGYVDHSFDPSLMIPLSSISQWMDKNSLQSLLDSFESDDCRGASFLRSQAMDLDSSGLSRTYLFLDLSVKPIIKGFFTVGFGHVNVPSYEEVSDDLVSALNLSPITGFAPTYVISHICVTPDKGLSLDEILQAALSIIDQSRIRIGCSTIRLDCDNELVRFYEDMGFTFIRKNRDRKLNQMLMLA